MGTIIGFIPEKKTENKEQEIQVEKPKKNKKAKGE